MASYGAGEAARAGRVPQAKSQPFVRSVKSAALRRDGTAPRQPDREGPSIFLRGIDQLANTGPGRAGVQEQICLAAAR
jgi:hypothetical protein